MKEELCNWSSSAESIQNWEARAPTEILKNQQPAEECIQPIQEQKTHKTNRILFLECDDTQKSSPQCNRNWLRPQEKMFIQEVVNTQTTQLEDELEQRNTLRILLRNFKENNSQNKKKATEIDQELRKAERWSMWLLYSYKIAGRLVATEKCKKGETCYTQNILGTKIKLDWSGPESRFWTVWKCMHSMQIRKKKSTNKQQQIDTEGTGDEKTHLRWPISCRPNWKKVSARRGGRFAFCTPIGGGPCFVR